MHYRPTKKTLAQISSEITRTRRYVDQLQVWLKKPIRGKRLKALDEELAHPLWGWPFIMDEPARFDPRYRQRLILIRPTRKALARIEASHAA